MQPTLGKNKMRSLESLAKKYEFDFGFVNDFGEKLEYKTELLSKVSVVETDPTLLLEGCQTVIVLAFKYSKCSSNIASFAQGEDYHEKLRRIGNEIIPLFSNSIFLVDTHQLNERYFAKKSGIGYIGKNSMFISDKYGSYCHLALILTTEKLCKTQSSKKSCGSCQKCIDVCPVNAISEQIDCSLCISEKLQSRNNLDFSGITNEVYGCDICQKVCPHNIDKQEEKLYNEIDLNENLFLTKKEFIKHKSNTFYWIGYRSFIRNIHVAYVATTNDYSKLYFLENSGSEYLQNVARVLRGEKYD